MEKKWYYAVDGVRSGPVTFEELRGLALAGALKELDLVWQPEFGSEWRNAGQVQELFDGVVPEMPPVKEIPHEKAPLLGVTGARPSCLAASSQAFSKTVAVLFKPFDMTRWFSMGFCAWLAYLGSQSSGNFNGIGNGGEPGVMKQQMDGLLDKLSHASSHPGLVALALGLVLLSLLFALWLCSLRSRGDFMFLHRWYRPDAPIRQCWVAAQAAGHELFVWRVNFFMVAFLLFALDGVYAYSHILKPYLAAGKVWSAALLTPTVACVTVALLLSLAVELVAHLAKAFVVPVMYWQGVKASRAWLVVFALCNQYPVAVLGYLIWGLLCGLATGVAVLLIGLLTCCIGFIPMILPYFGAVVLLPVYLFFRGYAVCFLSQWRPELIPASA
jgi:hypothetical protein